MDREKRTAKERLALRIAGVTLTLVADENREYMLGLAEELDRRMNELMRSNVRASKIDAALFCALDALDAARRQESKTADEAARADRFMQELAFVKQENEELKLLLGAKAPAADTADKIAQEAPADAAGRASQEAPADAADKTAQEAIAADTADKIAQEAPADAADRAAQDAIAADAADRAAQEADENEKENG